MYASRRLNLICAWGRRTIHYERMKGMKSVRVVRPLEYVARVSIVCRVAAAVVTRLRLRKLRDNVVGRRRRAPQSNSLSLSVSNKHPS